MAQQNTLPPQAFDGQIFIDAFRVKWQFDGKAKCWRNIGTCPDIPVASELNPGLLSAKLKQVLDGVPPGGGHFGIIAQPLLTLKKDPTAVAKDQVRRVARVEAGTRIRGHTVDSRRYSPEQFVGKMLMFLSGILAKKAFLIFTNDEEHLFLQGDATAAKENDRFQIVESSDFNPSGVLLGDILLVSDTIDITCVGGDGLPLANNGACNLDYIQCDENGNLPPGLNFELNKDFLDSLCVTVPGCKGPVGKRGEKGDDGADGTGDGPTGETGDVGDAAPDVPHTFTGVKIIDIDDIYDTAVVSIELDAAAGKLNIVRAKVKTPDNDTPATKIISTPINRSVNFTDSTSFNYTLSTPTVDPIGVGDVDILKYPDQYTAPSNGGEPQVTNVNRVKLTEILDAVIAYYESKLSEINNQYNLELKDFIEDKDSRSREILAELAMQVAECEFELPLDFCIGIQPDDCKQNFPPNQTPFNFPFANIFFGTQVGTVTAVPLGDTVVPPLADPIPFLSPETAPASIFIEIPNLTDYVADPLTENYLDGGTGTHLLPCGGYVINYDGGGYNAGGGWSTFGLTIIVEDDTGNVTQHAFPQPDQSYNANDITSLESAYAQSSPQNQALAVELGGDGGKISVQANVDGIAGSVAGAVKLKIQKVNIDC